MTMTPHNHDPLEGLREVDDEDLAALHRMLETRAGHGGAIDIAYRHLETPVGPLLIAATTQGLVRVAYQNEGFDTVLMTLATKLSPRILQAPKRLDTVARELDQYFTGQRTTFDVPLDTSLSKGFRHQVQLHLPSISYGHTLSYSEVAELVGNPRAVRAVGTACATNPLPIVLPCHRVLRADGTVGRYIGGTDAKNALLTLERSR